MVLLRHITAPSPAYTDHYYSAVYSTGAPILASKTAIPTGEMLISVAKLS